MSAFPSRCRVMQCMSNCLLPISTIAVSEYHTCSKVPFLQLKRLGKSRKFLSTKVEKSYYEILELSPRATQAQIKEAYYKLSRKYHPDQHHGKEIASENFRAITEAYEVLINLQKKKLYDKGLYQGKAGPLPSSGAATPSRASSLSQTSAKRMSAFSVDQWHQDHYKNWINLKSRQDARAEKFKMKQDIKQENQNSHIIFYIIAAFVFVYYQGIPYLSKKLVGDGTKAR